MVAGVNGAGKTTSIGKLTALADAGASVLLAAADTFRAAAREQLAVWADRNRVEIISQQGGDPSAVSFDAVRRRPRAPLRRGDRRHRRPPAHAAAPDGRAEEDPRVVGKADRPARRTRCCWWSTATPGRTRWRR
jgi:hypothetical protein